MARLRHGEVVSLNQFQDAQSEILTINANIRLASAPAKLSGLTSFDYMFPRLQADPTALLPSDKSEETVARLVRLGATMNEPGDASVFDSAIPSAYTYFGQFVDHDITLELQSSEIRKLGDPTLKPLSLPEVHDSIKNKRSPTLDLDSVYGATSDGMPVPRTCAEMVVASCSITNDRPPNRGIFNDLPRKPSAPKSPDIDREALIGDGRNDENLILSQLHVAFLHAHNALVARSHTFNEAKKKLVQHYQWLVIHDFLMRIADKEIVKEILRHGNGVYRPSSCDLYMPLEFSVAAFRFGHSMVRSQYVYNVNEGAATLEDLFSLTAFSGSLGTYEQIPEHWIIEWKNFLDGGHNVARRIDTRLVEPLFRLQDISGQPLSGIMGSLAIRNLLRGYLLRLPIGQRVAAAMGLPALSPQDIERAAATPEQAEVLREAGFLEQTPLWYYILAEASSRYTLGPVGSTIVAEVLIGLIRWSDDSILGEPGWKPTLGATPGIFTLKDLFLLGGVWG
jgi:hypothetical protein